MVNDLLNQKERKFIFDLTGVEEIDSTGANILIQCFLAARKTGAGLRVAGASAKVARLFKITRLDTVLPVYAAVAAACEGFTLTRDERVAHWINTPAGSAGPTAPYIIWRFRLL